MTNGGGTRPPSHPRGAATASLYGFDKPREGKKKEKREEKRNGITYKTALGASKGIDVAISHSHYK